MQLELDQVELWPDNRIGIRFKKVIVEADGTVHNLKEYHRISADPGADLERTFEFEGKTYGVPDKAKNIASVIWTAEVVDKFRADVAAAE